MRLRDQFRFVRQNMKKNKTRVFMTILATAMGCAFLIVLASVGFGLHKSVVKETMEMRMVTEIDVHGIEKEGDDFKQVTSKEITFLESIEDVKSVTRRKKLQQGTTYELGNYENHTNTLVTHVPSEIKAGFELSKGRLPEAKDEVVVGYNFVKNLASKDTKEEELYDEKGQVKEEFLYKGKLIGEKIELTIKQFVDGKEKQQLFTITVVGIGKKPTKEWVQDNNVFISDDMLKDIEAFTGTPRGMINEQSTEEQKGPEIADDSYDEVKVYAKNAEAVEGITAVLTEKDYLTYSVLNELKQINMLFTIVKAGLIFIGTIAILIASIGIYNTMTMAVTERAPDIGIMKAIGANPKTIKQIFLLESSYIGLMGAIIGTIVSYAISYTVNFALPLIIEQAFDEKLPEDLIFSSIPISLPIICVTICYLVTILSGLRPAKRATKVDVLKAMRREV